MSGPTTIRTLPALVVMLAITLAACMTPGPFPQPESDAAQPATVQNDPSLSAHSAPPLPAASLPGVDSAAQTLEQNEVTTSTTTTAEANPLTPEQEALLASLPDYGPAPELTNEVWLNSEPLQLADLRGQVVIVEFWTYG